MSTPSTTPPFSEKIIIVADDASADPSLYPVVVDWPAINAKWDAMKAETPLQTMDRYINACRTEGSSAETIRTLCILRTNMWMLHFGGEDEMKKV